VARIIESALKEVDPGVVQAARAMGSTPMQIIMKVLLPEAMPSLVSGVTLTIINLIGYSAMAGAIGGGGLGDLAIRYGYQGSAPTLCSYR
jgi:D-methionine transport system permease protein